MAEKKKEVHPKPSSEKIKKIAEKIEKRAEKPARETRPSAGVLDGIAGYVAARYPELRKKLEISGMPPEPNRFIKKCLISSFLLGLALALSLLIVLLLLEAELYSTLLISALAFPALWFASFHFFLREPEVNMLRKAREIDKDLLFAGRHLLIELRAGVPLFDALTNITSGYGEVSKAFASVIEKVNLGVPMDVALHDISQKTPSPAFRRLALQIVNSIRSGSDVADALEGILDQIAKEQLIDVRAYGQKLSPLVMFYMIFGIILPSLGVALAIILLSFMGSDIEGLGFQILAGMAVLILFIQYIFLTLIESTRPRFGV